METSETCQINKIIFLEWEHLSESEWRTQTKVSISHQCWEGRGGRKQSAESFPFSLFITVHYWLNVSTLCETNCSRTHICAVHCVCVRVPESYNTVVGSDLTPWTCVHMYKFIKFHSVFCNGFIAHVRAPMKIRVRFVGQYRAAKCKILIRSDHVHFRLSYHIKMIFKKCDSLYMLTGTYSE